LRIFLYNSIFASFIVGERLKENIEARPSEPEVLASSDSLISLKDIDLSIRTISSLTQKGRALSITNSFKLLDKSSHKLLAFSPGQSKKASNLFNDCITVVQKCHACQTYNQKIQSHPTPLHPVVSVGPFAKWGIDFITCHPHSAGGMVTLL
jgi:hypothetical protein